MQTGYSREIRPQYKICRYAVEDIVMLRSNSLAALVLSGLVWVVPVVQAADVGRIKLAVGEVHIERAGQRLPGAVDTPVQASDTIVTGPSGSVGITFIDHARISAGPNSVLAIERYAYDHRTQGGVFDATLRRGTLAVISGKMTKQSPSATTIRTSTMVLGVRGTEFVVQAGD